MDGHHCGLPGVEAYLGEDGHEHLSEGLEAFGAVSDVVDHEVAVLPEAGVVEANGQTVMNRAVGVATRQVCTTFSGTMTLMPVNAHVVLSSTQQRLAGGLR